VKLDGVSPGTIKSNEAVKAKANGEAELLRPILEAMVASAATLREMALALAGAGRTTRNGQMLSATQVKQINILLSRIEAEILRILQQKDSHYRKGLVERSAMTSNRAMIR
jgi:hypothetical protein